MKITIKPSGDIKALRKMQPKASVDTRCDDMTLEDVVEQLKILLVLWGFAQTSVDRIVYKEPE